MKLSLYCRWLPLGHVGNIHARVGFHSHIYLLHLSSTWSHQSALNMLNFLAEKLNSRTIYHTRNWVYFEVENLSAALFHRIAINLPIYDSVSLGLWWYEFKHRYSKIKHQKRWSLCTNALFVLLFIKFLLMVSGFDAIDKGEKGESAFKIYSFGYPAERAAYLLINFGSKWLIFFLLFIEERTKMIYFTARTWITLALHGKEYLEISLECYRLHYFSMFNLVI